MTYLTITEQELRIERRAIRDGQSSVAVILPLDWRKVTGVKAGDILSLEVEDDSITIRPTKVSKRQEPSEPN